MSIQWQDGVENDSSPAENPLAFPPVYSVALARASYVTGSRYMRECRNRGAGKRKTRETRIVQRKARPLQRKRAKLPESLPMCVEGKMNARGFLVPSWTLSSWHHTHILVVVYFASHNTRNGCVAQTARENFPGNARKMEKTQQRESTRVTYLSVRK